jgi:hypothetical protein
MSKKTFVGGLGSLLGDQPEKPKRGRPKTQTKKVLSSSQEGTKENETRATFIINEELLDKVKALAYWDRILIKDIVNKVLEEEVNKRKPKPRPEEVRLKEQEARLPKY